MCDNYDTFLGGACNPTTWRTDAIRTLEENKITYYNPQKPDWSPELVEYERKAKENSTFLLFVFQPSITTGVSSLIEVSYLSGFKNNLVLVMPNWTKECNLNKKLNLEQAYKIVRDIAVSSSTKIFETIDQALGFLSSSIKENSPVDFETEFTDKKEPESSTNDDVTCNHVRSSINSFLDLVEDQINKIDAKHHKKSKTLDQELALTFKRESRNFSCHSLDFESSTLFFQAKNGLHDSFHLTFNLPSVDSIQNELKRLSISGKTYDEKRSELIVSFLYKSKDIMLMNPYQPNISIRRSKSVENLDEPPKTSCFTSVKRSFSHCIERDDDSKVLGKKSKGVATKRPKNLDIPKTEPKRLKCERTNECELIIVAKHNDVPKKYSDLLKKNEISFSIVEDPSDHNQFLGCLLTIFIINGKSVQISNLVHASYLAGLKFPIIMVISPDLVQDNLKKYIRPSLVKSLSQENNIPNPSQQDSGGDSGYVGNTPETNKKFEPNEKDESFHDEATMRDFIRGITYIRDLSKESLIPVLNTSEEAFEMAIDWLNNSKTTYLKIKS